jgi:hypothetical protein
MPSTCDIANRMMIVECHGPNCASWNSVVDDVIFILAWNSNSKPCDATCHGMRKVRMWMRVDASCRVGGSSPPLTS